jgi:hypothetical protein
MCEVLRERKSRSNGKIHDTAAEILWSCQYCDTERRYGLELLDEDEDP